MKKLALALSTFLLLTLVGCASEPGADKLKEDLQSAIKKAKIFIGPKYSYSQPKSEYLGSLSEVYELLDCKKTNGQKFEMAGIKGYSIEFDGNIRVKKTIFIDQWRNFKTYNDPKDRMNRITGSIPAGVIIPFSGKILYEQTDNGWRSTGHKIKMGRTAPKF